MRISLLQRREPFADILCETLSRHWSAGGVAQQVSWGWGGSGQRWWGNSFLNYFAAAGTPSSAFEVLRHEYSRAPTWWKRPAQRVYVSAGTHFPWLRPLSDLAFTVRPGVAEAGQTVVLGGNHRLRLLHRDQQCSTLLLKERFETRHLQNELELRESQRLECAPRLLASSRKEQWLREAYVVGTPINRLSPALAEDFSWRAAQAIWSQVVAPTLEWVDAATWCDRQVHQFAAVVARCGAPAGAELLELVRDLATRVTEGCRTLPWSWTHGDLQASNILVKEGGFWVIDWESATRRFAAYDFYLLAMGGRAGGPNWPARVALESTGRSPRLTAWLQGMPGLQVAGPPPRAWTFAFLMEELWYRALDAAEPAFLEPGGNWPGIVREVAAARNALL